MKSAYDKAPRAEVESDNGAQYKYIPVKDKYYQGVDGAWIEITSPLSQTQKQYIRSLSERTVMEVEIIPEAPQQVAVHTPAPLDQYFAKAAQLELRQRAQKGAELMLDRAAKQVEDIGSLTQQAEDELNLLALQALQAQDVVDDAQQRQEYPARSGDAWTPAHSAELNKQLSATKGTDIDAPSHASAAPASDNPFNAFIENIGTPKDRMPFGRKIDKGRRPIRKKRVVVMGSAGVALAAAATVGFPMVMSANKPADESAEKSAVAIAQPEADAIAKKQNPDITPASIALGQCLADGPGLFSGHASGASSEAWVFKAADGTLKGAQTPDKKYLPLEVQSAPFDVAACAPADARAAIVTMQDTTITIARDKVSPEIQPTVGGTVIPTIQDFAATPEAGLTDVNATALNAAQADQTNKNSVATIAYANLARAIAKTGSVDLGRVEAQMDTELVQSVNDQITAFYKKQGKDAPAFNLTLTGEYLAPKVIDPATLPDILTKTKDIVRLTPTTLTALDFNTNPVPAAAATPTPSEQ